GCNVPQYGITKRGVIGEENLETRFFLENLFDPANPERVKRPYVDYEAMAPLGPITGPPNKIGRADRHLGSSILDMNLPEYPVEGIQGFIQKTWVVDLYVIFPEVQSEVDTRRRSN
ncbi:hypothetical protein FRC01_012700, partial [Tulasnella sp. 417]